MALEQSPLDGLYIPTPNGMVLHALHPLAAYALMAVYACFVVTKTKY
jgi:hypothetical protein